MRKLYDPHTEEAVRAGADEAVDTESAKAPDAGALPDEPSTATETSDSALTEARRQASENYEKYLRAVAEMQNVLRRQERERAELGKYAAESLARDLLPTLDDLERALEHSASAGGDEGFAAGVEMVRKGLLAALEKHGVVRVSALGQPFDPSRHEAVAMVDGGDAPPNTVVAVHRAGYMIGDRLLRPAIVVVAMSKATATDE